MTRSNLQRLRCCVCHFHHEQALRGHLIVFDIFSQKYLRRYDTTGLMLFAGDATAAAYRYQQRQEYQDLCKFWVAVTLREMLREVNMSRPFQSRLHCHYSTNNHHSQLRSTGSNTLWFAVVTPELLLAFCGAIDSSVLFSLVFGGFLDPREQRVLLTVAKCRARLLHSVLELTPTQECHYGLSSLASKAPFASSQSSSETKVRHSDSKRSAVT